MSTIWIPSEWISTMNFAQCLRVFFFLWGFFFPTLWKWYSFDPVHRNVISRLSHALSLLLSLSQWFCVIFLRFSWCLARSRCRNGTNRGANSKITSVPYFSSIWWFTLWFAGYACLHVASSRSLSRFCICICIFIRIRGHIHIRNAMLAE